MTLEDKVKAVMGEQAMQILFLSQELETAKAKIEELEGSKKEVKK